MATQIASDAAPTFHGRSKAGTRWTHELVAYGLDLHHRRHLRTPTIRELRAGIADLPSYATIRRLYGSAGNMLHVHGYRVRTPGGQPGRTCMPIRDDRGRFLPRRTTYDARAET